MILESLLSIISRLTLEKVKNLYPLCIHFFKMEFFLTFFPSYFLKPFIKTFSKFLFYIKHLFLFLREKFIEYFILQTHDTKL